MIYQPQYSKKTLITKFLATTITILSTLISSPALSKENIKTYSDLENFKEQLLEDTSFLSKLREKIAPHIDEHNVRKIIRNYLLTNPEIMIQMQFALQEKFEEQRKQRAQEQASNIHLLKKEIFQSPHDAILGNPNGKIVLVNFFDYNCSFCKKSYAHIKNLIKEHPDLQVIIKDLPILGNDSIAAHTVAYAFRKEFPEKYSQFYETLLTQPGRANEATALKVAISLGASEKKLRNAIQDTNLQNSFKQNIQIASTLNITGTPSYIIGNKLFIGAVSEDVLREEIQNMQ
ncbi:DsbA family protein [Bartonella sp. CB189]|uniref:DsbA family protein n=1 Tax=Bartonella sp. CB189 TaxID=3112254 RepID=UPI002F96C9C4